MILKHEYATKVKLEDDVAIKIDRQRLWLIRDNETWLEFEIRPSEKQSLMKQLIKEWLE